MTCTKNSKVLDFSQHQMKLILRKGNKMKFNVEIDIDWIDEENNLDDTIKDEIISKLTKSILVEFSKGVSEQVAVAAENLVKAKTEMIINTALEQPITVTKGWNDKKEYASVYDMVEQRMTKLYEGKLGGGTTCEKDPLLGNIQNYVDRHIQSLLSDVENKIKRYSADAANTAVKESALLDAISQVVDKPAD